MNALADDAANVALDRGADWEFFHAESIARARVSQVNYRMCFDGAKRGAGDASAGLALLAYYENGERDLLLRAGKLLGHLESSFLAEALALEWSLELFFSVALGM